eukprot:11194457-Lingulodinium_polyedra.AAC.1
MHFNCASVGNRGRLRPIGLVIAFSMRSVRSLCGSANRHRGRAQRWSVVSAALRTGVTTMLPARRRPAAAACLVSRSS